VSDGQIVGTSGAGVGLPGASTQFGTQPPNSGFWTYATLPAAASSPVGTLVYTTDEGFVYSTGVAWIPVSGAGIVISPDGSINVSGGPGNSLSLTIASSFYGALNILPGKYLYANLPAPGPNFGLIARTTDTSPVIGPVFSNGVTWLPLFNQTNGVLQIATGTPLPAGANGTAYSDQLTATGNVGAVTWSEVSQYAVTGTANTFTVSSAGVLACASPTNNSTTAIVVQAVDTTGAAVQKTLTVAVVASVTPAATPTFTPAAGNYSGAQTVTISCSTGSSTIYYTTNGSTPTVASTVYTAPFSVSTATTVKAIAIAAGFTQSAVGSISYTFAATTKNPIGGLISMGGAGAASYESFPIFKNRVREGRSTNTTWDTNGWPNGTSVEILLWEPIGGVGGLQPSWLTAATSSRPFKCGFNSPDSGTFVVTPSGCTIANFVQGAPNAYSTFDLYVTSAQNGVVAFTVSGLTTGAPNMFAYLPAYPASTIDDPTLPSSITNEAAALWAQLNHAQLEWTTISMYNTTQGTSTSRNTPTNTQMAVAGKLGQQSSGGTFTAALTSGATGGTLTTWKQGPGTWSIVFSGTTDCRIMTVGSGTTNVAATFDAALTANESATFSYGTEGRPIEWYIALAVAANTGLWICLPIIEDGSQYAAGGYTTQVFNLIATARTTYPAWTGTIYIKTGNENWNGGYYTYYTLNYLFAKYGYANQYTYLAYRMHAIAQIGRSVFGAAWGVSVKNVLDWQVGTATVAMTYIAPTYMVAQGWTPSADIAYMGVAPYSVPTGLTSSSTIAQIQSAASADAATRAFVDLSENLAISAMHWGMGTITYESNFEWSNSGYASVTNLSAAINDSGMIAPTIAYQTALLNSGFQILSQSVIGIPAGNNSSSNAANELGNNYATQIASGSPVWQGIQNFYSGFTPTRNVINGSGSTIPGGNYADKVGAANPGFPGGIFSTSLGSPYYNLQGYIGYFFNSPAVQTLTLTVTMAGTGTPNTDVEIGSLAGFTKPYTSVALAAGANVIGSVTIQKGPGYILFGNGTPQTTLTISQLSFGTASNFDFFISTTGSDSNVGSLVSPWSITAINTKQSTYAGKRLGIMPGTYDVSVLMQNAGYQGAVLQIQGGPNSSTKTYIATCNSSGVYQAGTATLDAKGSVGQYGGGNTAHVPYVLGQTIGSTGTGPQPTAWGNWTIDGILFTGFSNWAVTLSGGIDTVPTQPANCTIQNCGFFNSVTAQTGTHPGPVMCYDYNNCLISNCWFYNNTNTAADITHYASITAQGFGGGSTGLTIQYCSFLQTPGIYIIEDNGAVYNTTVLYNYFDMTTTANVLDTIALVGGTNSTTGQLGNSFHHNIVRGGGLYDNVAFQTNYSAQSCLFYNNTWDRVAGSGGNQLGFRFLETPGSSSLITAYNNLMYDNGGGTNSYGYMVANVDGVALCDYNIYGTLNTFSTYGSNGGTSNTSQTFTTWKSAIGGKDAHSSTNGTNPFTNNGTYALQYQVQSGSPAFQTGFVGGVSSGAVCNVGAWDGTVTQIGCNLPLP
jgi:hypothetical protein